MDEVITERMEEIRIRKQKKNKEPFKPPEDKIAAILTINESIYDGREWLRKFREYGRIAYGTFKIQYAYPGMPIYIYNTSEKGIVADSKVGSNEDLERLIEEGFEDTDSNIATPLINFRTIE